VDPGVGATGRPVALAADRGDVLVRPDNGLLVDTTAALGEVSVTLHGRDLFAPASALLTSGVDPRSLGLPLDPADLVRVAPILVERTDESVAAPVIDVDRFGNVGLGVEFEQIPHAGDKQGAAFLVGAAGEGAPEWTARMVQAYGDLAAGELGLIRDSWGQAAVALNGASPAEFLGLRRGVMVTLTPAQR
jgi:S-adenosylmethionine hydrolase